MSQESIPEINVSGVHINHIRPWTIQPATIQNIQVPVTLQLGFPIVDMPGCVEMHKDNINHTTRLPFDKDLVNQDPKGSVTLCPNGQYPSYNAMDYQPEQLIIQKETPPPPVAPPPEVDTPEVPDTGDLTQPEEEVLCPGPNQPRVGDLTQKGDEKVTGHELSPDGKTCIVLYEPTTPVEKFLPSTNQVTTTTAIAVLATASAAATPLLIRVIKPVIKKVWTTVQKKLSKGKKKDKPTSDQILKKNGMKKLKITD